MVYSKLEFKFRYENCIGSDSLPFHNGEHFTTPSPINGVTFSAITRSGAAAVDAAIVAGDGSSPLYFPLGNFHVSGNHVLLDEMHHCPLYIARDQFELWQNTRLIVDDVCGRGASLSAEIPLSVRLVAKPCSYSAAAQVDLRRFGTGGNQT